MKASTPAAVTLVFALASACSTDSPSPGVGGGSGGAGATQGGSPASGGGTAGNTTAGTGVVPQAGSSASGSSMGGSEGVAGMSGNGGGGAAPVAGSGGSGGLEPGDTPPWRPLNVTAGEGEHLHGDAGIDTRAKPLGKLGVDIGVNSGGYVRWLAKRGYHVMGAPCGGCPAPNLEAGRDEVGNCRLDEFENTKNHVKSRLTSLHEQYPEEDWGYFLNEDGSVRWSDVAVTGMSHGATTAAVAGRIGERLWRVVSRSGPRDDTCGAAGGVCKEPLSTPSYDAACPANKIASWLDAPSKTPLNRFYGLVGTTDVQCGDIMFDMFYAKYPGQPVVWDAPGAVLTGSNQFFSTQGGHLDFLLAANTPPNTDAVLELAFGIPPENQNPAF